MDELLFNSEHYWVSFDGDTATVGLSNYLLDNYAEISHIDLPSIGSLCNKTDVIGLIYADDEELNIDALFSGEIVEINEVLLDDPMNVKDSSIEFSWLYKIIVTDTRELEDFMTKKEYKEFIENNL